jgi:hypothetical protein
MSDVDMLDAIGAEPIAPLAADKTIAIREAWMPLPPEILANALQDRIHETSGRLRAARAVKVRR